MVEASSLIFDAAQSRTYKRRRALGMSDHNFLIDRAAFDLADRLGDITRQFPVTALSGLRASEESLTTLQKASGANDFWRMDTTNFSGNALIAEDEFLPFAPHSLDLYLSNFGLHMANDLPGALIQIRRALKPDGLFLGAMPGGETLFELRQCLQQAEMDVTGGLSPRIHPFVGKQDMGALLQRAGFALPVVDSETLTITYDHMFALLDDLRGMGASNSLLSRHKSNPGKTLFHRAAELYAQNFSEASGQIIATVEIIFLIGWAPHASQPQPLKPGSAKTRLADVLGTKENPL